MKKAGEHMNVDQITTALLNIYNEPLEEGEKRRIVFWTDVDEEFKDDFETVQIDGVKVIHLHKNNQFYTKHLLEEEDPTSSYLIYTNLDLESEKNWLYDTAMYSKTFYADKLSLIMKDLSMDQALRPIVQQYFNFFNRKENMQRLKAFEIKVYTKETIELAMMNILCKQRSLDFETVLRAVLMDTLDDEDNRYLQAFDKYFDVHTFWDYTRRLYDYQREETSLQTLFMHLAVTAFSQSIDNTYLTNVQQFIADQNKTNAYVFIDHWMHHSIDQSIFQEYIMETEKEIQLKNLLSDVPVDAFKDAGIFPYIDRAVILYVSNSIMNQQEDYDNYLDLIELRRTKHFYEKYQYIYEALFYTVKMYAFYKRFAYGIPQQTDIEMYNAYIDDYYVMDTYYRKFYVAFDAEGNSELLLKIKPLVENLYTNWFMGELSANWSGAIAREVTDNWTLPGVQNQQDFYQSFVAPHMEKNERAFVVISDALRYEVGKELQERLDSEIMGTSDMDTMLSVVPSVTKFGMAALLPHRKLEVDEKGNVLANGMSTSGIDGRKKVLASYSNESIAIHFDAILKMNKAERRETFKGKKLIYIYHDTIDATGDNADKEMETFDAAEQAMDQLSDVVRIIRNDLSGTHIYITADHGFLYERDKLTASDFMHKTELEPFETSRRYILSHEKKEVSGQLTIDTTSILDNENQLYAYVPNATIRYRIQGGGANFVHGGASLQEVIVPLLSVKNKRAGQKGAKDIQKVDIQLTSTTRNVTNSIFSLAFFQTEKVADKFNPRTVVTYMADGNGAVLSNEERIIGDLTSENPKEREFNIQFVLKNMTYDKNKTYYLVIKDMETDVITEKIPFTINLGIVSDFDF
ncbi:MAG TPA: BREX-1 system phosphatase PglZ type A [Candidatus Avamphibacillus sp.]|nr:BREX-1 system phosphatase PglZ type A [Candidatus Avamphibacillus sp.]